MPSPEVEFEAELEVFRREAESAVQFFYAWRTVNEVAAGSKAVVATLNKAPLFWNTALGALQTASFIALGRVFDQEQDTRNIDRALRIAQRNPEIFRWRLLASGSRVAARTPMNGSPNTCGLPTFRRQTTFVDSENMWQQDARFTQNASARCATMSSPTSTCSSKTKCTIFTPMQRSRTFSNCWSFCAAYMRLFGNYYSTAESLSFDRPATPFRR